MASPEESPAHPGSPAPGAQRFANGPFGSVDETRQARFAVSLRDPPDAPADDRLDEIRCERHRRGSVTSGGCGAAGAAAIGAHCVIGLTIGSTFNTRIVLPMFIVSSSGVVVEWSVVARRALRCHLEP